MGTPRRALCVLVALCAWCAQSKGQTEKVLDKVRASVVKVELFLPTGASIPPTIPPALRDCFHGGFCILGSGMVVNSNGDVITASHVAADAIQAAGLLRANHNDSILEIGIPFVDIDEPHLTSFANTVDVDVDIAAIDQLHDLALLHVPKLPSERVVASTSFGKVSSPPWPAPVKLASERARDAEPIFECGFPLGETSLVTTNGSIASAWSSEVVITARNLPNAEAIDVYKLDIQSTFGNSGGPIFRVSDQAVVGIIIEGSPMAGVPPVAVPSKYVVQFLTDHHVSWVASSSEKRAQK